MNSLANIKDPNEYISFQLRVDGLQYTTLIYVELRDSNGKIADYCLKPSEITNGQWTSVLFRFANSDKGNISALDLATTALYFSDQAYPLNNPPLSMARLRYS